MLPVSTIEWGFQLRSLLRNSCSEVRYDFPYSQEQKVEEKQSQLITIVWRLPVIYQETSPPLELVDIAILDYNSQNVLADTARGLSR